MSQPDSNPVQGNSDLNLPGLLCTYRRGLLLLRCIAASCSSAAAAQLLSCVHAVQVRFAQRVSSMILQKIKSWFFTEKKAFFSCEIWQKVQLFALIALAEIEYMLHNNESLKTISCYTSCFFRQSWGVRSLCQQFNYMCTRDVSRLKIIATKVLFDSRKN